MNKLGGVTSFTNLVHFLGEGIGKIGRPVSMLSFLIDDQYFPVDPTKFRYTNLMLHLLCGLILFLFIHKLLSVINNGNRALIAVLVFAFWLLHPLNVSTTAYIVQRMTQLMSLFTLLGLFLYIHGRSILVSKEKVGLFYMTAALFPFGLLAVLSKENGILICVYIMIMEITVLHHLPKPNWYRYWLGIFIIAPVALLVLYLAYKFPSHHAVYSYREFTLSERLLTESRILVDYLYQILVPPSSGTGLYHDDIQVSTSLFSPLSTTTSALFILTLVIIAIRFRKKQPVFSFATLWFFSGHILESTYLPLELYFEHRNYLPMVGPLFALVYYCIVYSNNLHTMKYKSLVRIVPVLLIMISATFTLQSATIWGKPEIMFRVWYQEHPNSLRAATRYAQMFEKYGNYSKAVEILEDTYQKHPKIIALQLYILKLSCQSDMVPPFNASDIIKASKSAIFQYLLPSVTKELISFIKSNSCRYINKDELIDMMVSLAQLKNLRGPARADFIVMLSELYVEKGMLSPAVEALDRAYKSNKSPMIALRQAELLSSAGLYDDALQYIEKAKLTDNQRSFLEPSYDQLILAMENHILKQKHKNTQKRP